MDRDQIFTLEEWKNIEIYYHTWSSRKGIITQVIHIETKQIYNFYIDSKKVLIREENEDYAFIEDILEIKNMRLMLDGITAKIHTINNKGIIIYKDLSNNFYTVVPGGEGFTFKKAESHIETFTYINDWLKIAEVKRGLGYNNGSRELLLSLIFEELTELSQAMGDSGDLWLRQLINDYLKTSYKCEWSNEGITDALADLIIVVANGGYMSYIDLQKEVNKVMNANYTKFCKTEDEAKESVDAYAEGKHPNKLGIKIVTYYKKVDNYYIILRKEDDKILKSINFKE